MDELGTPDELRSNAVVPQAQALLFSIPIRGSAEMI